MNFDATTNLQKYAKKHIEVLSTSIVPLASHVSDAINLIVESILKGGKLLLCGNGGSAADAQHFAAELVSSMFKIKTHKPLPAIALTTDSSTITSFANDISYDEIFVRQLEALARKDDVIILFSTSGKSKNIIRAAEYAIASNLKTVLFTGQDRFGYAVNVELNVQSGETHFIQEVHEVLYHFISAKVLEATSSQ